MHGYGSFKVIDRIYLICCIRHNSSSIDSPGNEAMERFTVANECETVPFIQKGKNSHGIDISMITREARELLSMGRCPLSSFEIMALGDAVSKEEILDRTSNMGSDQKMYAADMLGHMKREEV